MSLLPPVRRIGIQTRSVTGTMPDGNRYESALERDLMELVAGDPQFDNFSAQPVRIDYVDPTGQLRSYTPDGLIAWRGGRKPLLLEVKYRGDCVGRWRELIGKFRAAKAYARNHGWDFAVFSEERVRGPRLVNVRFLRGYKSRPENPAIERILIAAIAAGSNSPKAALDAVADHSVDRAAVLSDLWRLVAIGTVGICWDEKLTMASRLSLVGV